MKKWISHHQWVSEALKCMELPRVVLLCSQLPGQINTWPLHLSAAYGEAVALYLLQSSLSAQK